MFCLFRKKEAKKENDLQKIHQRLCQNECILINNMLYWKNNDRLTGTVVDEIGNQIRIDMDVLDNWLYPDSYKQQALTKPSREFPYRYRDATEKVLLHTIYSSAKHRNIHYLVLFCAN